MFFHFRLIQPTYSVLVVLLSLFNLFSVIHSEKSLFDDLPLNGAFVPSNSNFESSSSATNSNPVNQNHQQNLEQNPPRVPLMRQQDNNYYYPPQGAQQSTSLFDQVPNQGAFFPHGNRNRPTRDSVDFDSSSLPNEFDVPFWDSRITPLVNSLSSSTQNFPPPPPNGGNRNFHESIQFRPQPFRKYGPPPSLSPLNPLRRASSYFFNNFNQRHYHSQPKHFHREDTENTGHNKTFNQVSANSGGPTVIVYAHPKKDGSSGSSEPSTGNPSNSDPNSSKNEIHYHYHINNEESKGQTGFGHSHVAPPPYGRPTFPPQRHHHSTHRPPTIYGPPSPTTTPSSGPYPDSRANPNYRDNTQQFSNSANEPSEETLESDEEDFNNRRTFFTSNNNNKHSNSKGYRPTEQISLTSPSTSYEVPPQPFHPSNSYNAPSNKYGPPGHHQEPDSYLPPTAPPAPPPVSSDQASGSDQYETTITLQTIPITRQVTELVQVPNVVHKISSNRPSSSSVSDQAQQDEQIVNTPSSSYGPPAPPPRKHTQQPFRGTVRGGSDNRPFDSHLAQILGVGPTQNPKDQVLQELLLGQARNQNGFDMNLSDLELVSLLQNSRGLNSGGGHSSILSSSPTRNLFGGLFGSSKTSNNLFSSNLFQREQQQQGINSDGLGSLREAFREQRFQLALADLRKQLREQNKDNVRERSGYRSLFTRGALLLSALTLLPSVLNPMASAAGVGSAAAASQIPNFMLPVTAAAAGRRKRSIEQLHKTPFEKCLELTARDVHSRGTISYKKWIGCANNLTISTPEISKFSFKTFESLNNIPLELRKAMLPQDLAKISRCVQRDLCRNILEFEKFPNSIKLFDAYSILTGTIQNNPWIDQSLKASKRNQCDSFNCNYK